MLAPSQWQVVHFSSTKPPAGSCRRPGRVDSMHVQVVHLMPHAVLIGGRSERHRSTLTWAPSQSAAARVRRATSAARCSEDDQRGSAQPPGPALEPQHRQARRRGRSPDDEMVLAPWWRGLGHGLRLYISPRRSLPARALRYDARVPDSPAPLIAGDVLTLPELRHLRRVSGLRGAGLVLHAWAVIIGAMELYVAWPSALTLVLTIALIGGRQLGLAVLMHEAAHWHAPPRPALNDWAGAWLCAYPVRSDIRIYRALSPEASRDDVDGGGPRPRRSRRRFRSRSRASGGSVWRDLNGRTACGASGRSCASTASGRTSRGARSRGAARCSQCRPPRPSPRSAIRRCTFLWVRARLTTYSLAMRIRAIAEHAMVPEPSDDFRNTRTMLATWWERLLHRPEPRELSPRASPARLRPVLEAPRGACAARRQGYRPRMEVAPSYAAVIRRVTSLRAAPRSGSRSGMRPA